MKEEIEKAIKMLAGKSTNVDQAVEAMQLSQAALNFAHVLATLDNLKK